MRRGRKRNRGTWFPVNPTTIGQAGEEFATWYNTGWDLPQQGYQHNGTPVAIPVTIDRTTQAQAQASADATLRDVVEGQEWLCERVVGKVWCSADQGGAVDEAYGGALIFCAALAVLPSGDPENPDQPSIPSDEWAPLNSDNVQQPWMWRRTWVLQNLPPAGVFAGRGAQANWQYGSVLDGPHMDCKSKRRIRREERLYIVYQVGQMNGGTEQNGPDSFGSFGYDLRVFGGLRKAVNQSTFG